jgi:ResB-like family
MATATKKIPPAPQTPSRREETAASMSLWDRLAWGLDAIYRFLASLKLAVISISTLAATLAYATVFESKYGGGAAQEWIYRSPGFAILLAFLGMNILCAALIRYPWKKRQTGFVVTHAGLLILLAGSFYSVRTADEGQVGMIEGDVKSELVRSEHPVIRIWEIDPHPRQHTGRQDESQGAGSVSAHAPERVRELDLPFRPGRFEWGPQAPRDLGVVQSVLSHVTFGWLGTAASHEDVLTTPDDPFRFVVKEFLPAAAPAVAHEPDKSGVPMARINLQFKGPAMPRAQDAFRSEDEHWFALDKERKFYRLVRSHPPAMITFSYVDRPELVEDFLKPPPDGPHGGTARFRYRDRSGGSRTFDWVLDGQEGKSIVLPDSDLSVKLEKMIEIPTDTRETALLNQYLGDDPVPVASFQIQAGTAEPVLHMVLGNVPMVPNIIPTARASSSTPQKPLAAIHYMITPTLDPKTNGRFGQIDVLAGPDEALYYRVFGRAKEGGKGELRASGRLEKAKPVLAFGGGASMPMTITFQVDSYLPAAIEKQIYEPVVLPKGQMDNGIPAFRAEMTVNGQTKEIWLSRSENYLDQPRSRYLTFGDAVYELMFDVDRRPLGFELKLDDFDTEFEPGTEQPTHFISQVRLTDAAAGIKDKPYTISMNNPLDHRGYTFYQSNYIRVRDPHTGNFTGQFESIFQVATNPGRPIIYAGCALVVLGTFLQFYMRAGVFTDGGKKERERALAKRKQKAAKQETVVAAEDL